MSSNSLIGTDHGKENGQKKTSGTDRLLGDLRNTRDKIFKSIVGLGTMIGGGYALNEAANDPPSIEHVRLSDDEIMTARRSSVRSIVSEIFNDKSTYIQKYMARRSLLEIGEDMDTILEAWPDYSRKENIDEISRLGQKITRDGSLPPFTRIAAFMNQYSNGGDSFDPKLIQELLLAISNAQQESFTEEQHSILRGFYNLCREMNISRERPTNNETASN